MKKEIGGYLELEDARGEEYYPELLGVNLGRTALLWLLEARNCRKLYLPYYLCDSVTEACEKTDVETEFYHMDEKLRPLLPEKKLSAGEYLYLVNYYGQLTDDRILEYKAIYENIIVDHTHAFFQKPLPGTDTLYSCRKFLGVSDGAYLSTDAVLRPEEKPVDHSMNRMEHILGRYEYDAGTFHQKMLRNAADYHNMEIRRMSRLTRNLLRTMDYPYIKKKREENYRILSRLLPSENAFNQVFPEGPFAYPYYHKNGPALRKWLAGRKIFVPTNWRNILEHFGKDTCEYDWAANVLPLPCDQRYGEEEMRYIAEAIKEWEEIEG